ncbi:hypothetical protein GCM10022239_14700 [Leifsonia bigeumensis]|uniref:Uncharacterized protein n=1 Tax=Leifsonella bigeumensis TaxID=433643 RepID=A0ABP7FNA1_9MICO
MIEAFTRSPREVDLLSWFTGPLVPTVFGGLAVVYGFGIALLSQGQEIYLPLELASVASMAIGFVIIALLTSSRRLELTPALSIAPAAFGWIGLGHSAFAHIQSTEQVELWWAPVGLGFLVAALAPYLSAIRLLVIGGASTMVTIAATAAMMTIGARPEYWPTVTQLLLGAGSVVVATVAAAVFSSQVVRRTMEWAASAPGPVLSSGVLGESARRRILRQELASVGDRAVPLLERVATAGIVTPADREQARALAEDLRAELVERSNRSWLESLARRMNLTVIDQDHRADRMNRAQRSALLGLLQAAIDRSASAGAPLVIELRGEPDGSTAVALSTDVALPEGRRLTLLAPHYVTLRAAVDELEWDAGEKLRLRFRLPPDHSKS